MQPDGKLDMANQTETEVSLETPQLRVRHGLNTAYFVSKILTTPHTVLLRSTLRNIRKTSARSTMPASCAFGQLSIRLKRAPNLLNAFSVHEFIISITTAVLKLMNISREIRIETVDGNDYQILKRTTIIQTSNIITQSFMIIYFIINTNFIHLQKIALKKIITRS